MPTFFEWRNLVGNGTEFKSDARLNREQVKTFHE